MPVLRKSNTRTRLDPELRRSQILDQVAHLITGEGLSAISMERVAKEAGVSKALVYAYFANQTELLQSLLKRDMQRIQREQMQAAAAANTFPELVRGTTHIALVEAKNWGPFVQRLMNEPLLANAVDPIKAHDHANIRYLAKRISEAFDMPMGEALRVTQIGLGLTLAAGDYLQRSKAAPEDIEDLTVAMIIGAVKAASVHGKQRAARSKSGIEIGKSVRTR